MPLTSFANRWLTLLVVRSTVHLTCRPWSQWQRLNKKEHRTADQQEPERMLQSFVKVADIIFDQGGVASVEWPRYCSGWPSPILLEWILRRNLFSSVFPGCAVGVTAKDDVPAKKPWRFGTSSKSLADNLPNLRCTHAEHAPLEGQWTRKSAYYPPQLCRIMLQSIFPYVVNSHVFSMPCVAHQQHQHWQKLVKGYPSVPLGVLMAETGCGEIRTPAFVRKLLDRGDWKGHPDALKAIENEKQGLFANGTWDESKIRPKSEVLAMARATGTKIHIGSLMVIVARKLQQIPLSTGRCFTNGFFCILTLFQKEGVSRLIDKTKQTSFYFFSARWRCNTTSCLGQTNPQGLRRSAMAVWL